jgi:hypothetical protein
MSTCYVAGRRTGDVAENERLSGYSPKGVTAPGTFSRGLRQWVFPGFPGRNGGPVSRASLAE